MAEGSGFHPERIVVEAVDDTNWRVMEQFSYTGNVETFNIERGMTTDFASVPRVFVWFLPRYGRYTLAAILHDHLWRNLAANGALSYIDADGIFRQAMRRLEVPFLRRWIMWSAVRWGALLKPSGTKGWFREAPRVLLVSAIAAPFLIPAAIIVGLSAFAFQIVEWLTWFPLKVLAGTRREPTKRVNAPSLEWKS